MESLETESANMEDISKSNGLLELNADNDLGRLASCRSSYMEGVTSDILALGTDLSSQSSLR